MREYGRQYVLQIGEDGDALIINNLRINFSFSHTHDKTANTGTIKVYNLSRDTINQIQTGKADRYHQVTLSVGYGDLNDVRTLFTGQLSNAVVNKGGSATQTSTPATGQTTKAGASTSGAEVDSILELTCDDGGVASRNAMMNTSFAAGSSHAELVKACASTMTGVIPGLVGIASNLVLTRGRVCYGMTRHILTQIASHHDADWSIQHGYLMIMASDYVRPESAVVLSQQTGMIGAPKKSGDKVTVTCLLRPEILIHSKVRIDSINDSFDGEYKVVDIKSEGDTHANSWKSTLELKLPESGAFKSATKANSAGGKA
jgi:hypothetical protein